MRSAILITYALLLTGCALFRPGPGDSACSDGDPLVAASYQAVDQMLAAIPPTRRISKERPVVVATLVDIDSLSGSRLGRTISEHLATRLTRSGYKVAELKLRESIFIRQGQGELLLSREVQEITRHHQAQVVLVGTYAESRGVVYVTVKLVGVADNVVISAHDYVLPIDANVRALLWAQNK
jgi:TolB-like protein